MREFLKGIIFGLVGAIGAAAIVTSIHPPGFALDRTSWILLILGALPVYFSIIAIHEAGHLVAGALRGFRPHLLIVGPLKFERRGARWTLGRNRVMTMLGGFVAGIPDNSDRLRQRTVMLIAGGPALNLLTGFAALAVLYSIKTPGPRLAGAEAAGYILLLIFGLLSLTLAGVALMPGRSQGYLSDGSQLLRFMKNSPEVEAEVALVALSTTSLAGQRPRDWDPALLERALRLPLETARGPLARMIASSHAIDRCDIETARAHLNEAIAHREHMTPMTRPALLLFAATFAALHDRDPVTARRWLNEAGEGALVGEHTRPFTEAAILWAEGNPAFEERLAETETALEHTIDRGGAVMLRDQIATMRADRRRSGG